MKAVVLAAGLGARLRPLTDTLPKCMLPMGDRPLLAHTLDYLCRYGIDEVYINLYWQPRAVQDYFGDGTAHGVKIHFFLETELSGTAGPLRRLSSELACERFLVFYSDNFTNLNIADLLRFHAEAGAELTIALHREAREDLPHKSIAETDGSGRLLRFVEKPRPEALFSEWAGAGIYMVEPSVIERIPAGKRYDFGHEFIPALLRESRPVYGFKEDFYLIDVGTKPAYRRATADYLAGRAS